MKFMEHGSGDSKTIEIVSDEVIINSEQDALDLMADIGYRGRRPGNYLVQEKPLRGFF